MKLKFLQDWRGHFRGEISEVDDGSGAIYLARGVAELLEGAQLESTPPLVAIEKRKRGRPKKIA